MVEEAENIQEPALKVLAYEQSCEIFCIGCEAVT